MTKATAPLKAFAEDAQTGPFGSQLHSEEYIEGGIPVINPSNIKDGRLIADRFSTVSTETAHRLRVHLLRPGDLVFARRGELGRAAVVTKEEEGWLCGTGSIRVRANQNQLDPNFAGYALQSAEIRSYFTQRAVGSTMGNLNTTIVLGAPIPDVPLEEQRRIADFLDSETGRIDRMAAIRKRQIDLLGSSEASIIGDTLESTGGTPTRVKHLATRITSGPRGWGDLVADQGSLFLRITNIPRRGITLDLNDSLYVTAPSGPERERSRTRPGDVLVSITADIGSVAIVDERATDANISQHIAMVRPDQASCNPTWLAYAIKSARSNQFLRMNSYGGTKVGLGLGDVANLLIEIPDLKTQEKSAARITQVLSQREAVRRRMIVQRALLDERRQSLITAAVTGQFDVSTASGRNVTDGVTA